MSVLDPSRDTAQAVTTALLHGDGQTAEELASEVDDSVLLAIACAELAATIHYRWAAAFGVDPHTSWAAVMTERTAERARL